MVIYPEILKKKNSILKHTTQENKLWCGKLFEKLKPINYNGM